MNSVELNRHKKREAKSCKMIYFTCWLEMCRFLNLVSFVLPSFGLHAHEFLRRLKVLEPISYHSAICFSFYIFNVALFLPNVIKSLRYPGSLPEYSWMIKRKEENHMYDVSLMNTVVVFNAWTEMRLKRD